jgi:outer membrane protein TolC
VFRPIRAERELAAQTARIGAAEAERFPKLTISGTFGIESGSLGDLLTTPLRLASLGPSLSLPIWNGGDLRADVEIETELQKQALLAYRETVLSALEEVENALFAMAKDQEKLVMRKAAVDSARSAAHLAEIQYANGLVDFNDVLDAQRSLLSFEDQLIENQGTVVADLVRLYKALGGGWQSLNPLSNLKSSEDKG